MLQFTPERGVEALQLVVCTASLDASMLAVLQFTPQWGCLKLCSSWFVCSLKSEDTTAPNATREVAEFLGAREKGRPLLAYLAAAAKADPVRPHCADLSPSTKSQSINTTFAWPTPYRRRPTSAMSTANEPHGTVGI